VSAIQKQSCASKTRPAVRGKAIIILACVVPLAVHGGKSATAREWRQRRLRTQPRESADQYIAVTTGQQVRGIVAHCGALKGVYNKLPPTDIGES
jgi:hypothetical protein